MIFNLLITENCPKQTWTKQKPIQPNIFRPRLWKFWQPMSVILLNFSRWTVVLVFYMLTSKKHKKKKKKSFDSYIYLKIVICNCNLYCNLSYFITYYVCYKISEQINEVNFNHTRHSYKWKKKTWYLSDTSANSREVPRDEKCR